MNNPINLIDPDGRAPDPPTNSDQVNSQIAKIRAEFPDSPIYLAIQSGNSEGTDRDDATNPADLQYDLHTIQEGTDLTKGSHIVVVRHGEKLITGGSVQSVRTTEIEKSYSLQFEGGTNPDNGNRVGGSDELTPSSQNLMAEIAEVINSNGQAVDINSEVRSKTDKVPSPDSKAIGVINGGVQQATFQEFGDNRISTVVNGLVDAGANVNLVNRGSVNFESVNSNGPQSGTYINFRFSAPALRNANRVKSTGTIQIDKSKFQIF